MRPVIGITCTSLSNGESHGIGTTYINAIKHAGGTPVLLPLVYDESCIEGFLKLMDGLLLTGGVDVDPMLYGEESLPEMGKIDVDKDRTEMAITPRALEMDLPVLGICRGIQLLNVAAGGTLHQDIYRNASGILKHRQDAPRWYATHTINIQEGSRLMDIFGHTSLRVNTFHHQAVKDVAPGFSVSAVTSDGIIEGIESTQHRFAVGLQCHPEGMWRKSKPVSNLFVTFVEAARTYLRQKIIPGNR